MPRYSTLIEDIRPWLPECPDRSIEQYGRRAVIQFCTRSRFWRETVTIPLTSEVEYDIPTIRPEGRPDQVLKCQFRSDPAGNGSGKSLDLRHVSFKEVRIPHETSSTGDPTDFGIDRTGARIRVWPTPNVANLTNPRLILYVVAIPTQTSRQFPDDIWQEWRDAITDGALWMLLRMPNKPWSNLKAAQLHRAEFFRQINDARRAQMTDGHATQRTRMRRWV